MDRTGKVHGTIGDETDQSEIQLSPDDTRVAVSVFDPGRRSRDIWIHDLTREGLRTRFTFDPGEEWTMAWSPDGRELIYSASRTAPLLDLYRRTADGSSTETPVLEAARTTNEYVDSWSQDGRYVLYRTGGIGSPTGADLWVLPLTGDRTPRVLLQTPFTEVDARFSPDGRWVSYVSNESGRNEIYVMSFSGGGKWQISTGGGDQPRWRRDGRELFYLADNSMMAVDVNGAESALEVGMVRRLFDVERRLQSYSSLIASGANFGTGRVYDVTADGQRFLVNVVAEQPAPPPITVITNWTETLR